MRGYDGTFTSLNLSFVQVADFLGHTDIEELFIRYPVVNEYIPFHIGLTFGDRCSCNHAPEFLTVTELVYN